MTRETPRKSRRLVYNFANKARHVRAFYFVQIQRTDLGTNSFAWCLNWSAAGTDANGGLGMFDKLIESDTAGAEFKNRSRYFTVSTIIVGILFLTAVVYSLYATELDLGAFNFDLAELAIPLDITEPDQPQQNEPQKANTNSDKDTPANIKSAIASVDDPTAVPDTPSAQPAPTKSRDWTKFNPELSESYGSGPPAGNGSSERPSGTSSGTLAPASGDEVPVSTTPPPAITKKPPTTVRKSELLNGSALYLPKPGYPKPAQMINLEGSVSVQVTIDEKGAVVSAKAANGHPFFRYVAEQAARGAKFNPTILNGVAVKVTGVIIYNFKKN